MTRYINGWNGYENYLYSSLSGILSGNETIDNEKSIKRLAEVAVAYAKAGKKESNIVQFLSYY